MSGIVENIKPQWDKDKAELLYQIRQVSEYREANIVLKDTILKLQEEIERWK